MYFRALDCGLDDAAFWRHSARAVRLLIKQTQEARAGSRPAPAPAPSGSIKQDNRVERVRLNRLPHP